MLLGNGQEPVGIEWLRRVQNTQTFLKMAAIELRRIAEQATDIAVELRRIAQQLETEAEDLAGGDSETASPIERRPDH